MPTQTRSFSDLITFTRASNATYFDSTGMLKRAASNASRIDYNPSTLAVRGLLVEESRTNLITYSEYFDNAVWTKSNTTVGVNTHTSPSGAVSADTIIENAGAGNKVILISISGNTNTGYTFSFFVKAAGRTQVIASFRNQGQTIGIQALFDLSAVTATTSGSYGSPNTQYTPTITSIGNGWYRCSLGGILSASSSIENLQAQIYIASGGSTSYTGDGTSGLYLWGAQLEAGAFATSYIPSSVTFSGRTSNGTYFDSAGVLQTAGSGVSRTTYNPSNLTADPFLLLEESRTNSIRNNTMVGAVAGTPGTLPTNWSYFSPTTGLTSSIVGTGIENGISYIDLRVVGKAGSAAVTEIGIDSGAATTGQTWTASLYWRISGGSATNITSFSLGQIELTGAGSFVTGAFVDQTAPTTAALNTQRISYTRTLSGGATVAQVSQRFNFIPVNGAAIDITLRIGMPQLEQGAYSTSVIPTSSAAVTRAADTSTSATATRAADTLSIGSLDPWYNENEGTILAEVQMLVAPVTPGPGIPFALTGTSSHMALRMRGSQKAGASVVDASVTVVDTASAGNYTTNISKLSFGYLLNNFATCLNGETPAVDTTGTVPILTNCNVGSMAGSAYLNGWIRSIKYYPRRLTNAELKAITT